MRGKLAGKGRWEVTLTNDRFGDFLRDYELYLDGKLPYEALDKHLPRVAAQISVDRRPRTIAATEHGEVVAVPLTDEQRRELDCSTPERDAARAELEQRQNLWMMWLCGVAVGAVVIIAVGGLRAFL